MSFEWFVRQLGFDQLYDMFQWWVEGNSANGFSVQNASTNMYLGSAPGKAISTGGRSLWTIHDNGSSRQFYLLVCLVFIFDRY